MVDEELLNALQAEALVAERSARSTALNGWPDAMPFTNASAVVGVVDLVLAFATLDAAHSQFTATKVLNATLLQPVKESLPSTVYGRPLSML